MKKIFTFNNEDFSFFKNIINLLSGYDNIFIKNGTINQYTNNVILIIDLKKKLNNLSVNIINPKKYNKIIKTLNNSNIELFDDIEYKRFILTDNKIQIFLPKLFSESDVFDISSMKPINQIEIVNDTKQLLNFIGNGNNVNIMVKNNKIVGIYVENIGIYKFVEDDTNEDNCDLYISYKFLNIPSTQYTIGLGEYDKNLWLYTKTIVSDLHVITLENINKKTINNILL